MTELGQNISSRSNGKLKSGQHTEPGPGQRQQQAATEHLARQFRQPSADHIAYEGKQCQMVVILTIAGTEYQIRTTTS
jgi:hypothetical protein